MSKKWFLLGIPVMILVIAFVVVSVTSAADNVALNKTATSDSYQGSNPPSKVVDGSIHSKWQANDPALGHWLKVDLGDFYDLTGDEIVWERINLAYQYKIEVSNNDTDWTLVVDQTNNQQVGQINSDSFTATARYIRLTNTGGLTSGIYASVFEFRVWGTLHSGTVATPTPTVSPSTTPGVPTPTSTPTLTVTPTSTPGVPTPTSTATTTPPSGFMTVNPAEISDVLLNPGKGWVVYGMPSNQSADTMAHATTGYRRYWWCELQPTEGTYNWSHIDDAISAWAAQGKKFAFGVMCVDTYSCYSSQPYVTPKWVFDAGAASTTTKGDDGLTTLYVPVWNDSIFIQKMQNFITAMAARYDGNPNVAFIDIRSYGNWGEQHTWGLGNRCRELTTNDLLNLHILKHDNVFQQTQLINPWGTTNYDAMYDTLGPSYGIGMRRDGILGPAGGGGSDGTECIRSHGYAPSVFEFFSNYQYLVANSLWSADTLRTDVGIGKPSYCGMGQWDNDAQVMFASEHAIIDELANKLGYHFVLTEAAVPQTISAGTNYSITMKWNNKGVTYIYEPCKVALALLDNTNNVKSICWPVAASPGAWAAGVITTETLGVSFSGMNSGSYKLAVGLFKNQTDLNPLYKLGIAGVTANGWYVLANITTQ